MVITDLDSDARRLAQTARLLHDGFAGSGTNAWRTIVEAETEVRESLHPERISRIALDETGRVVGWIGGQAMYDGFVWELHPLVVSRDFQRRGIGRALVYDLERLVAERGGNTILLGTDDENGRTSVGGVDVYPDVLGTLARIQNRDGHPFEFYQRLGFTLVGLIPDANGFGKPDILMAKRVAPVEPAPQTPGGQPDSDT